jgi:hypothetical protein
VEVVAAAQKIDVYTFPDPARAAERAELGLLGELCGEPSLFEPFRDTPSLRKLRRCLNKQHTWHHELERRTRATAPAGEEHDEAAADEVAFPALVVIGPGQPATVLDAYGCQEVSPGVYEAVWGLALRIVVIAELPRTRATLLLRLLGKGRPFSEALADLAALPDDAWERRLVVPLLVHFQLETRGHTMNEEDDVSSTEIRAWFEDYQRKVRDEGRSEGRSEGHSEGRSEGLEEGRKAGERSLLLRLLRARFGELSPATVARVEAAEMMDLERWGERMFDARTLADVLDEPS